MAIPAGKHLGPYEVVSLIGAGGMGEVYEARAEAPRPDRKAVVNVDDGLMPARTN